MDISFIKVVKVILSVAVILSCVVHILERLHALKLANPQLDTLQHTRILKYELDGAGNETNISAEYTYRR